MDSLPDISFLYDTLTVWDYYYVLLRGIFNTFKFIFDYITFLPAREMKRAAQFVEKISM